MNNSQSLKVTKDRKVANGVTKNGKQALISNTFGLPAGALYSCPGQTSVCGQICYAERLERVFPSVKANLLHNWSLLKNATTEEMIDLINEAVSEFERQSDKRDLEKIYRIHWDGDFFDAAYVRAWMWVIAAHEEIQFWVYTRNVQAATVLAKAGLPNLALYFSTDSENHAIGEMLHKVYGIRLAYLSATFEEARQSLKVITGKRGLACPEQTGRVALIDEGGSACSKCGICVSGVADVAFSITGK